MARRAEIAAAAARLGYRPDPMLASLSAYRQSKRPVEIRSAIAWINQWPNPKMLRKLQEFDSYWHGAHDFAERLGYHLEEIIVGADMSPERLQQILAARNINGILVPPHQQELNLPGFDWNRFSVIRLGTSVHQIRSHIVTSDQLKCASLAFEQIWARGYRRIGFVTSDRFDRNTGSNFRAGYLSAQDKMVPLRQHLAPLLISEENSAADLKALKRWMHLAKPDALLTTPANFPELLKMAGLRVPADIAVAATSTRDGKFDSGVDQNPYEVGRVALATLAAMVQQNERGLPEYCRRILVEGKWVDGKSLPKKITPNH